MTLTILRIVFLSKIPKIIDVPTFLDPSTHLNLAFVPLVIRNTYLSQWNNPSAIQILKNTVCRS